VSRRRWIVATLAIIALGFAVHFGLTFPWTSTLHALATADWALLIAAAFANILAHAVKGVGWYLLLRRVAPVRFTSAQVATYVGAALGCITVSVSGDLARARVVASRDGFSMGAAGGSLIVTRLVEVVALLVFMGVALIAAPPFRSANLIGLGLTLVAGGVFLGYRRLPWDRIRSKTLGRWRGALVEMVASTDRIGLMAAVLMASVNWLFQWAAYQWSIAATHLPANPAISLSVLFLANAAGILRLTPGNVGVLQGSMILVMKGFGIAAASALAAGLALQAVQVLPVLAIGMGLVGIRGLRQLIKRRTEVAD
jgi:uncharacterized protein (TIRG00374 family)